MKNGPYSNFHLEGRLWGQNDENLHNFAVITDVVVMIERQAMHLKGHLMTKFVFIERHLTELDNKVFVVMVTHLP